MSEVPVALLALRHGGRVASFDQALPWETLARVSPELVELLR